MISSVMVADDNRKATYVNANPQSPSISDSEGLRDAVHAASVRSQQRSTQPSAEARENRNLKATLVVVTVVLIGIICYLMAALNQAWENERALDRKLNNYTTLDAKP